MIIVLGLLTFLVGCGVVLLVMIYMRLGFQGDCFAAILGDLHQAMEQRAVAERAYREGEVKHRDATATIVVGAVRDVGRAVVRELVRQGDERRKALGLLEAIAAPSEGPFSDWGAEGASNDCAPTPQSGCPIPSCFASEEHVDPDFANGVLQRLAEMKARGEVPEPDDGPLPRRVRYTHRRRGRLR